MSAAVTALAGRRADALRQMVADRLRAAGGIAVSVEGDAVVARGRGLRLRAMTDPAMRALRYEPSTGSVSTQGETGGGMSAEAVLCEAIGRALAPLGLNAVFAAEPARGREPFAIVEPGVAADWSTKDRKGREMRPVVSILDAGDEPARLRAMLADAAEAIEALPVDLPGWRIASCVLVRARHARVREGRWRGMVEFRVRMMEEL